NFVPRNTGTPVKLLAGIQNSRRSVGRELLLFWNWSTHAFWSIGAVWRAGPGDDCHLGNRQHNRCSVDFLAQSGECILQIVWFETYYTTPREGARLGEDT